MQICEAISGKFIMVMLLTSECEILRFLCQAEDSVILTTKHPDCSQLIY